ncbi:MAG: MFS transporter [Burkholderiales bacterium]
MPAPNQNSESERSLRYSLRDAAAFSVMTGAGESYISAFALQLKASAQEIALLASVPALLGSWTQLYSAWLGERGAGRKTLIISGAIAQAVMWLPLALLPLFFPAYAGIILIVCVVLYHAAGSFITPQWGSLMRELVSENARGRYFALRTRISSMTAFLALVSGGALLHFFTEEGWARTGFLTLFAVAAIARVVSTVFLSRMTDPEHPLAPRETLREVATALPGSPFFRFSLFFALMQASVAIASPFFTLHMLRNLEFTYLEFTACSATAVLAQFLTLNAWGRISERSGNRVIFAATGLIIPFLPVLWTVSGNFWWILFLQALGGLCWAGFSLSAGNFIYDLLPDRRIAPYMATHNVLMNIGVFTGAMIGAYLAIRLPTSLSFAGIGVDWAFPVYNAFVLSTIARLAVSLAFLPRIREVRAVESLSLRELVFRVTRFRPVAGLIFDIVSGPKKDR